MSNPNTTYDADIVIATKRDSSGYAVFHDGQRIGEVDHTLRDLIVAGANARRWSVFDATGQQYLTGTLDQAKTDAIAARIVAITKAAQAAKQED